MSVWGRVLFICLLAAVMAGCGESAAVEVDVGPETATATQSAPTAESVAETAPTATPSPAPDPAPTPAVEADADSDAAPEEPAPTRTQSIILYDLTEIEKTCPGYQEFTGFRQTVSQVKITCTSPGVETVYFVDLDNLVVTGIRVPLLEPEMP